MKISTKNTISGKVFDKFKINKSFSKYSPFEFDKDAEIISPVEAKVAEIGKINLNGEIISKNNKIVNIQELIGEYYHGFLGGTYINFYLSPKNKHFWITPSEGYFVYTKKNEGKAKLPVFIGLEKITKREMFSKAVKKNASISSIFKTEDSMIAMIAVGSLNVNRIHTDYQEEKYYSKATPCGYFSLGSSMLLCFQKQEDFLINKGEKVKIGQKIK